MEIFFNYLRTLPQRQFVRPLALLVPALVLLVALPLLRPLRKPELYNMSPNELSRLATVQAFAEHHSQEIEGTQFYSTLVQLHGSLPPETVRFEHHIYSDKSPVLSFLLSGIYLLIQKLGMTFEHSPTSVIYLLTLFCSVIPVAASGGMIYRMARLFELRRPLRTLLALAVTFGTGLITYAVVINAQAPAAALVLAACACLIHTSVSPTPTRTGAWLMFSGFWAALAAVIDPTALVFLIGLIFVIVTLRWKMRVRFGAALLYLIGALPPLVLHVSLCIPVTGDIFPPGFHSKFAQSRQLDIEAGAGEAVTDVNSDDDDAVPANSLAHKVVVRCTQLVSSLVGSHGVFSHFPVLIFGIVGISTILRRHWPTATKFMAALTLLGGVLTIVTFILVRARWGNAMFGPRWSMVFLPLMMFWAGAWLRKKHHPIIWSVAGTLLTLSIAISILGITAPFISTPDRYSVSAAIRQLVHPTQPPEFQLLARE